MLSSVSSLVGGGPEVFGRVVSAAAVQQVNGQDQRQRGGRPAGRSRRCRW
jgi:hypothetical protein